MKHGSVSELVTVCKQLAPNLLNAKVDVSYISIHIESDPPVFPLSPRGGNFKGDD